MTDVVSVYLWCVLPISGYLLSGTTRQILVCFSFLFFSAHFFKTGHFPEYRAGGPGL